MIMYYKTIFYMIEKKKLFWEEEIEKMNICMEINGKTINGYQAILVAENTLGNGTKEREMVSRAELISEDNLIDLIQTILLFKNPRKILIVKDLKYLANPKSSILGFDHISIDFGADGNGLDIRLHRKALLDRPMRILEVSGKSLMKAINQL